jgi:hypothetical protein
MSSGCVRGVMLVRALIVACLSISFSSTASATSDGETGTIRGVVLDTRDGAPVDKVLVRLQDSGRAVTTDDAGRFEIDRVAAGSHELYVSAVDFILVKQTLTVSAGETTDVTIALTDGTGSLTQAVTVVGSVDQPLNKIAPSAQVLQARDLQQLRGLITNGASSPFAAARSITCSFRSRASRRRSSSTPFSASSIPDQLR